MPPQDQAPGVRRPVQVLAKVGDVLSVLAAHGSLGASEIAERIDEPRSSVYRLLRTLRQLGYVDSKRRGEVQLGPRLFQLGAGVAARFSVREAARPPMEHLHEQTGGTVHLFVRRGDSAACIDRLDGRQVRLEIVDVGEAVPLHSGAGPRALLAFSADRAIDQYLDDARLELDTAHSPATPREVRRLLAEIRATGFAVSDQDHVLGVASVAAPVRNHTGAVVAALTYSGIAQVMLASRERERSIRLVVEAAEATSRRLGWLADTSHPDVVSA